MIKDIIVSGCSYSCVHTDKNAPLGYWPAQERSKNISYPNFLKKSLSTNLLDLSMCGYSNTKILKSIYDNKITNEALDTSFLSFVIIESMFRSSTAF